MSDTSDHRLGAVMPLVLGFLAGLATVGLAFIGEDDDRDEGERYEIVSSGEELAVWRIDSHTGRVSLCALDEGNPFLGLPEADGTQGNPLAKFKPACSSWSEPG